MTRIRADDQDPSLTTDDLALLAHWLDRGSYLHARFALFGGLMVPDRALAAAEATATQTGCARRAKRTPKPRRRPMLAGVFGSAHVPAGLPRVRHPASIYARRPRHPAAGPQVCGRGPPRMWTDQNR